MTAFEEDINYLAERLNTLSIHDKRVLITGATGLIGSILVRAFIQGNENYQLANRIVAQVRDAAKAGALFGECPDVELIIDDITAPIEVDGPLDYIIHTVCETDSQKMISLSVESLWTSLAGSKNVLDLARDKHIEKMVYLSSMEAFGVIHSADHRAQEDELGTLDLHEVRSWYPESKRMVESMCVCYWKEYGVPVTTARLAQTFGAGMSPNDTHITAQFARSVMNGEDLVLHTKGTSYGNYIYTADAIAALLTLLVKGEAGETYSVVNESSSMTIRDMAQLVAEKVVGGAIRVTIDIDRDHDYGYAADTELLIDGSKMRELGWEPRVDLEEAYRRLIQDWTERSSS